MEGPSEMRAPSSEASSSTASDPLLAATDMDMSHELGLGESLKSAGSGPLAALALAIESKGSVTSAADRPSAVDVDVDELPPGQVFGDDRAGTMTDLIKRKLARSSEPGSAVASTSYRNNNQRAAAYEQQDDVVLSTSQALLDDVGERASSDGTRTATDSESSPRNSSPRRQHQQLQQRNSSVAAEADDQNGDGSTMPFSATQAPEDDMFDELAIDRELQRSKQAIALQAERDSLWEEAFLLRRQIMDEEAAESSGNLAFLFATFEKQTEIAQTEDGVRALIYMSEAAARGALEQEVVRERRRIESHDAEARLTNAENYTRFEVLRSEGNVWEEIRLQHHEAQGRILLSADEDTVRRCIEGACESERASVQRALEHIAAVVTTTSSAESAERVFLERDSDLEQRCLLDGIRVSVELLAAEKCERDAAVQAEMSSRKAALAQEAARLVATCAMLLFQSESQQRGNVEGQESSLRARLIASHKKASENFVPRKPPVPRCSRVIRVPHPPTPPLPEPPKTNVDVSHTGAANVRPTPSRSPHPKIKKVKPLPLRRLPPVPHATGSDAARPSEAQCRLLATATDEGVGRKSLNTREHHEWLSMISTFRHALHSVDHEQRSPGERSLQHAYRTSTYPFHIADKESARFAVLKEEAKRRRLHHEERYRLQALVTKLIAVDVAFESRVAARLSAGQLGAPRPVFSCAFSETDVWDRIPNAKNRGESNGPRQRYDAAAGKHGELTSNDGAVPQRPQTAGVGCPRPPAAPRSAAPRSATTRRAPPKRALEDSGKSVRSLDSPEKEELHNQISPPLAASNSPPSSRSASTASSSRSSSPASPASSASSGPSGANHVGDDSRLEQPRSAATGEDGGDSETKGDAATAGQERITTPDARNDSYTSVTETADEEVPPAAGGTPEPPLHPARDNESNSSGSSSSDSWHPMTEQSP